MAKYFKTKKMMVYATVVKYIIILVLSFIFIRFYIYSLSNINPSNYLNMGSIIGSIANDIKESTINKPVVLLNYRANIKEFVSMPVFKVQGNGKKVYLYNTHQIEKYSNKETVVDAASYFKRKLEESGVEVTVDMSNITEFLNMHNYAYSSSYVASRYFIEEDIKSGNYDLIIDMHRDGISHAASTAKIGGKNYAKILFVIGKKNKKYEDNLELAESLNKLISDKYPELSRGVLLQSGSNVNGVYNQDLNRNMILLEVGGSQNSFEEVKNTLDLIAPLIGEYLNEQKVQSI